MGHIVKPMHLQLVSNADGTGLLEELGAYAYVIQESSYISNTYWQGSEADIIETYNSLGIDNELEGNLLLNPTGSYVSRIQTIAPLTRSITISQTGYLKLLSSNGYYAVSSSQVSPSIQSHTDNWKLYDSDGNFLASCVWTMGLPATFATSVGNIVTSSITNGVVSSKCAGLQIIDYTSVFRLTMSPTTLTEGQLNWINGLSSEPFPTDPYNPGSESGTGGGGGSFDNTSTPIDIPNLPSISAASTGFISLFNPTLDQLNELSSYLWSDLFEINGWKKLFADPMDAILGLSIVPVAVPSGGVREVKVGNIGTGISLTVASSQFVEVDCGSIDVKEYWGAYLDYEPYTQAQIFLPYIGTRPISVDDIMGKTVRVVYHVDILTGACCCFVKCGDSVLYTYNGQCSIPIPITGANYASVVNGVISIAASVGSLVATGGSSAPTAISAIATSAVNQMKPQVEKSGSISGSAGVLNMQTPYLILIRPRQALPSKQNEFIGYPSLITVQLTELKGYTEVQSIHLENIPATQEELAEIESLLKGGAIF